MFHKIKFQGLICLLCCLSECRAKLFRQFSFLKGPIEGQIPTTGFLEESLAQSEIDCARTCAENQNCTAVYYLENTKACKIHDQKMSEFNGTLVSNPDVVCYEIDRIDYPVTTVQPPLIEGQPCPEDDSVFSTAETSDGISFNFRVFIDAPRTFSEARSLCNDLGATLFKVLSPEKLTFVQQLVLCPAYNSAYNFWLNGETTGGTWSTIEGEPINMTTTYWAPARPNETPPSCLWLASHHGYYFDDLSCSGSPVYTICEF